MRLAAAVMATLVAAPLCAQEIPSERAELETLKRQLVAERAALEAQRKRLEKLEEALLGRMRAAGMQDGLAGPSPAPTQTPAPAGAPTQVQTAQAEVQVPGPTPDSGVQPVGQAPEEPEPGAEAAVLANQGGVLTRAGRVTLEAEVEYGRADRNRFVFRGIQVPQSVLVGIFDINESRQDVLTAAGTARLGVTNRLEVGVRVPYVYRSDSSVVVPLASPNPNEPAMPMTWSVNGDGVGDIEATARFQLTDGLNGRPFLIAGVQAVAPTGSSPFKVDRLPDGRALEAATGAGFWGVAPTLTALLPTDPAVLFATLGYTFNFAKNVDAAIGDTLIERVDPGDAPSASAGIGLALNQRTSLTIGYAHSWSFPTKTRIRDISATGNGARVTTESRDLQIGRLMFGVSYRSNPRTTINWNIELGATEDATDVRTTLRIPFALGR